MHAYGRRANDLEHEGIAIVKTLKLSDGRYLAYDEYGDPDGTPVIFNHGLADSRLIRNPDDGVTASLGVRVIAADQPGVGGSSPQPCRRMVDWGKDIEELVDALGLGTFNVAGHSSGAPHALAITYRLSDRVGKIALASPVAPLDEPDMSELMINREMKLVVKLHHLHHVIKWAPKHSATKSEHDIPHFVETTANDDPSDADTFLTDPALREMFVASFAAGMSQGDERLFEITMALWDWGFKPEDINQHVELFYGDADDILDPKMPQHLGARLPNCTTHVWNGAGHYGFVDRQRWIDFLTAVA
jgi:pimeloyl-ACP methyl ester carboxylesterase